jgi:6-phosphogluconolactonase
MPIISRRSFLRLIGSGTNTLANILFAAGCNTLKEDMTVHMQHPDNLLVFVGTYNTQGAKSDDGIYIYRLDLSTGALKLEKTAKSVDPSYLTLDSTQRFLYTVNETMQWEGQPGGGVSAYALDPLTAQPTLLNQQPSLGGLPCYISVDQARRYAFVANYAQGNVILLPIQADGRLGPASDMIQQHGSGANPQRQAGPHAHSIVLDPAQRYALEADLGIDKEITYEIDYTRGKLVARSEAQAHPGAGPRHLVFHPNGKFAYLIQEVNSTITVFAYHAEKGTLEELQTVSTLPAGFAGYNTCADIHISPAGRFLYGSNRGHDSIATFAIDDATGRLTYVGHVAAGGKTPRNFAIDPTGAYMLVANQDSSNIVTYRIDSATGKLQAAGPVTQVNKPVCVKIVEWGSIH